MDQRADNMVQCAGDGDEVERERECYIELDGAHHALGIKGIYLRMNGTGGVTGSAILEELREALVEFKQSGKFIVAYNETYSQGGYYLASVADKIYIFKSAAKSTAHNRIEFADYFFFSDCIFTKIFDCLTVHRIHRHKEQLAVLFL